MSRILVVDDEPTVRELVCAVLDGAGHETVGASSGGEALEAIAGGGFNLVVTDVVMPGLDGFELLGRVQESNPGLPVLLVTGAVDRRHALTGAQGASGVLYKPFTHTELREAVARALED